jgi:hypothetical protein
MNRKNRNLRYIRIKNSWRESLKNTNIIEITIGSNHDITHNPKHPLNMIIMDFKNRKEICKYGVINLTR